MFGEQPTILSSENASPENNIPENRPANSLRRILLIIALVATVAILATAIFFAIKKYWPTKNQPTNENNPISGEATTTPTLPDLNQPDQATSTLDNLNFSDLAIEYLSFADFYEAPDNNLEVKLPEYKLPLNVKIEATNYYDLSRKINLDPGLEELNNNGFTIIDNPWYREAPDFFSIYNNLDQKQIPLLITSDFMIYYYQNVLKKAFKDIEENVFYDNLWSINQELYTAAKNRYEARLAAIGNVNDSILEGERLEMAFFAVSLELLKPASYQVITQGSLDDQNKFSPNDVNRFYFVIPPYLKDDVAREVKLIREATEKTKSPVMLYSRDYKEFTVPVDYRSNAKLNNFYLTTKWLNSVFPLNYRDKNCSDCLLDKEDWRINLIAASLISYDFSSLPELKNKWARIYKVISFFKGLREDLNYVHYRDSLIKLFGEDYQVDQLFDDRNKDAQANLEKLRQQLLAYDFSELQGAFNKKDSASKGFLGFKMLAEAYWPNSYLFGRLTTPAVDVYLGTEPQKNNVTVCQILNVKRRCNGFALDLVNLVNPIGNNDYFIENTNYQNYSSEVTKIKSRLDQDQIWQTTNYWFTLSLIKSFLEMNKQNLPLFAQSAQWRDKSLNTAAASWINLQLPLEKFSINQIFKGQGLNDFSRYNENSYIEPNLNLVNELIANSNMLLKMFSTLRLDYEVGLASQNIQTAQNNLTALRKIIIKELTNEELTSDDNEIIINFAKQWKVEPAADKDKQLTLHYSQQKTSLKEDLGRLKLLVLIHQRDNNRIMSVGPVWDYRESQ